MADAGQHFRRALRWFRQRKVLQVLAVYLGASWIILEVTSVFIAELGLPRWFFPAAVILLLIGLTVVVATAIVEYGAPVGEPPARPEPLPKEILAGRLPSLTWPRALLGGVLAFGMLALVGVVLVTLRGEEEAPVVAEASANAVAVLPFRTSGESLELWREGLMDVLSANLDDVGDLRAIDSRTVLSRWRSVIGDEDAPPEKSISVAHGLGARWAVHGQAVELGGQVRFDAKLYEAETGAVVASSRLAGPPDSILALIEQLTLELLQGLGEEERFGTGGRAFTTTSLDAVRAYLEGEQAFRRSQWEEAIEHFERALDADSTFAMAALRASLMYGWRYRTSHPRAIAESDRAVRFAHRLSTRDRELLYAFRALELGRSEAIERARELATRYPDDPEVWYTFGEATYHLGDVLNLSLEERAAPFERALALDSSFVPALIHRIELAANTGDLAAWDHYARWYLSHDSVSGPGRALLAAYRLARGSSEDSLAELGALAERSNHEINWTENFLWNTDWLDALEAVVYERTAPHRPIDQRFRGQWLNVQYMELWRGRPSAAAEALRKADELRPGDPIIDAVHLENFAYGLGDAELAAAAVQRRLWEGEEERDKTLWLWWVAGAHLSAGDLDNAAEQVDSLSLLADRLRAARDSIRAEVTEGFIWGIRGQIAAERADYRAAVTALRRAIPLSSGFGPFQAAVQRQRFILAGALAELGQELEALQIFESFDGWPYFDVPASIARAQLYEKRGEREKAIRAYSRVVKLWQDCDPKLRPRWEAAERALSRLLSES